ncbi:MAG: hypothetical protein VB053_01115 [Oscillibacter ruminantium]|uniref:hypothetical protein n=1 Tax=Oscillibacter ruminantium TaxID=1263547 RepID=UPI002B20FCEB|nr:hypothetical protein [Oscillibacter ruminantium]MEA5041119.1 hypothetical protein [Oscillibacter ruminantium]
MNQSKGFAMAILGVVAAAVGFALIRTLDTPGGILRALPYVLVGLGCGAFGHGVGAVVSRRAVEKNPEAQRRLEIDQKDERNIAIANCAKARAWEAMTYIQCALMLAFALMGTDMAALLLLVFADLFAEGVGIYYRFKYDREM